MAKALLLILLATMALASRADTSKMAVLVLAEQFPHTDTAFIKALTSSLKAQGFATKPVSADTLASELSNNDERRLLILPNSAYFPVDAKQALVNYVTHNGNLLTIGGPPLSKQVVRLEGKWLTQQMLLDKLATMQMGEKVLDFNKVKWSNEFRDTGTPDTKVEARTVPTNISEAPFALELKAPSVRFWEFQDIPIQKSIPPNETVTTFWAKGNKNARKCIVAWLDSDGARWYTNIELTTSWKRYALTADLFVHWKGPGGPDDRFQPQKAVKFKIGFENHNLHDREKPAMLWISDVHTMPNPAGNPDFTQPLLETLSPSYKTYRTTGEALIRTFGSYYDLPSEPALKGPVSVVCSLPRYRGLGFNKTAPHRWIPQLAVRMADGHIGGAAAALYVQDDEQYCGSIWATLGIDDPDFLASHRQEIVNEVVKLVQRIDQGIFLLAGGTDHASYFEEVPTVGAVVLNLGSLQRQVSVECKIADDPEYSKAKPAKPPLYAKKSLFLSEKRNIIEVGSFPNLAPGFYVVTTSLYVDGKLIDQIRQPFSIVESKPVDKNEIVTIKGDQFIYKGKPWYSLGINYRPIYVAAMESGPFWEHWCHPNQYDAEIVEIELDLMNKIGLNTVSLIYENPVEIPYAFVDFMERAHKHGIKCHVYIAGLEPLWPKPEKALELIKKARLWERPAMFAYDTGWEVRIGREERRRLFDAEWKRWIEDQYGSVENAEKDWQFTLRKKPDGGVHGPTDEQVSSDGPWRRMVAAYRRFWDDRLSRQYMKTAQVIRSIDPYHPISVRSGFGGTGTMAAYALPQMPVDLCSGAKHLDFISPEGYNFAGDMQSFREGGFTTLYGKFVSGGKPIYWAELGYSASPNPTPETLEAQREYYEKIYKVFYETRSAGSAAWWWPGYLIWEKSDYAVINPDFTLRPAAFEFTKMAKMAAKPYPLKKPDYWIEIDRDLHTIGYAGILAAKRAEYGMAVSKGKTVGLRTKGTGTDSSNFPRIAVGGTPLNGNNPPKFLNAEFNSLEIQDASGKWIKVEDGDKISIKSNTPIFARASLGNTNEVKWLAKGESAVYLRAIIGESKVLAPISQDTPFLCDAEVRAFKLSDGITTETLVSFQMVTGDIAFGEKRYVSLLPN
ncbi:MAG: hypothetical protein QHH26_04795 [Armatimonadota bacterium]|nr:hypothetical protein [Armatimonadota bacterium]